MSQNLIGALLARSGMAPLLSKGLGCLMVVIILLLGLGLYSSFSSYAHYQGFKAKVTDTFSEVLSGFLIHIILP